MTLYKICHLTTVHSAYDVRIFHKELKSLFNAGYSVTLIAPHDQDEVVDGISIIALRHARSRLLRMLILPAEIFMLAYKQRADIYHFHDPELILVGLMLRIIRKRVVYDVHEDYPRQILYKHWIAKPLKILISRLFELFEDFAATRFNAIIAATPFIGDRFIKSTNQTYDICNYPKLAEFSRCCDSWQTKDRIVCYIGGITEERGIFEMLKAIEFTDARFLIAGKITPSNLESHVTRMKSWNKVEYLGQLDRAGIKKVLSLSRAGLVLLHPTGNYIDALPIKMFEYMAAGIPVIASNFPLWIDIVEVNNCGICVDPMNTTAIASAINWILDHPVEAEVMGKNGIKTVYEKYNWEHESERLILLYSQVLSS